MTRILVFPILFLVLSLACHCMGNEDTNAPQTALQLLKQLRVLIAQDPGLAEDPDIRSEIHKLVVVPKKQVHDLYQNMHKTIRFQIEEENNAEEIIIIRENIKNKYIVNTVDLIKLTEDENKLYPLFQKNRKCLKTETVNDPENDQRKQVDETNPYRWVCAAGGRLTISFPDKTVYGTGFLVGKNQILTAGHCLYRRKYGGYATKILFSYYSPKSKEWKQLRGSSGFIVSGWSNEEQEECDYGMIILKRDAEDVCCFMGLSMKANDLKDLYINVTGFPNELPMACGENTQATSANACQMFTAWGIIKDVEGYLIKHNVDTSEGQSGAMIWILEGNQPYSIGIHTQGFDSREGNNAPRVNTGVMISEIHFQNIIGWIKHGKP